MRTIRKVMSAPRVARVCHLATLCVAVVLGLAAQASAQVTLPDIGFDGEATATAAGTALGAILVVIIGLSLAFMFGRKFVRWMASYVR